MKRALAILSGLLACGCGDDDSGPAMSDGCPITPTAVFGREASQDGELNIPGSVALDVDGHVYVCDLANHRIVKFTAGGDFVRKWGIRGSQAGQFEKVNGVAVDAQGNVYVSDPDNDRIQQFDRDGVFQSQWPGAARIASGTIAVDQAGIVYIGDVDRQAIRRFFPTGRELSSWSLSVAERQYPRQLAVGPDGRVYIIAELTHLERQIQVYDAEGRLLAIRPDPDADCLAVGPDGTLFVAHTSARVTLHAPDGRRLAEFGVPGVEPESYRTFGGIVVGSEGNSYLSVFASGRIIEFDTEGALRNSWGMTGSSIGEIHEPRLVAADRQGALAVVEAFGKVSRFDRQGRFLDEWTIWPVGSSGFSCNGIAFAEENIVVLVNNRVWIYAPDGRLLRDWGVGDIDDEHPASTAGMCLAADGYLYVTDVSNARVKKFTLDGSRVDQWEAAADTEGQPRRPILVSVAPGGDVFVGQWGIPSILRYTNSGELIEEWRYPTSQNRSLTPTAILADADGGVLLTEMHGHRLLRLTGDGTIGFEISDRGAAPGQLNEPQGLAIDGSGNLFVADSHNDRVQKFQVCTGR